MKKPASVATETAPSSTGSMDRGRVIGLTVLSIVVVFVASWLAVRGKQALAAPMRANVAVPAELARFRADQWFLPDEPLLGFVTIPAGMFTMGSDPAKDPAAYENEGWSQQMRQGQVDVDEFFIGRYEVTIAQFAAFVKATGRAVDSQTLQGAGDLPVANVTWADAIAYAHWLEAQLRANANTPQQLAGRLGDGWALSLPSEAQWEKAARGADARIYPWGNAPDNTKANFGRSGVVAVGAIACAECAFGLADMSGNVWELTRSPFQPYPYVDDEPRTVGADALFVMRGGAFNDGANNVRSAIRGGIDPGARRPFIGFRLVLTKL